MYYSSTQGFILYFETEFSQLSLRYILQTKIQRNDESNTPSPIFNGCPNCGFCSSPH